jgi:hypothetical protein
MSTVACSVSELTFGRSFRALRLESDMLSATVLVDKGADIYELVYRPRRLDVLWKTPWGIREPGRGIPVSFDSATAWLEHYPGGWQLLFPNGGDECVYRGVKLNFHGEASTAAWDYRIVADGPDVAEVQLHTRLFRSPFRIERSMRVEKGRPVLTINERITNESNEPMDIMWGHHPTLGAPFLSTACRIDCGARSLLADDEYAGFANVLRPGRRYTWPTAEVAGATLDLSRVPGRDTARDLFGYLQDFQSGWYAVTNQELGFGFGLVWPVEVFPYAWFWQEVHASPGFPFYKGVYTMAIEPFSSIPGQGLAAVMQKTGTQRVLAARQSVEATLRAVFYEAVSGVSGIKPDGTVLVK